MPVNYDLNADPELTTEEQRLAAAINEAGEKSDGSFGKIALGVGAAFLLYRMVTRRGIKQAVEQRNPDTAEAVGELAIRVSSAYMDSWIPTLSVNLALGYRAGLAEVKADNVAWAATSAERYARTLGASVNETSVKALVEGLNAQINRGVPLRIATNRVIDAFGVTPQTMKALVNVWTKAPTKLLTSAPKEKGMKASVDRRIADAITARARTIGETEAVLTKNSSKALYWAWQAENGKIPGVAEKEWITANDERTCPVCAPLHRKRVLVTEKFPSSIGPIMAPGIHPRCRCVLRLHRNVDLTDLVKPKDKVVAKSAWGVVHKARGSDEYDRDRNGRFATTESRGATASNPRERFKEYEPIMRPPQIRPMLSAPDIRRPSISPSISQPNMRRIEASAIKPREINFADVRKTMAQVFQGKMSELEMDKAAESIATSEEKAVKSQAKAMDALQSRQKQAENAGAAKKTLLSLNLSSGHVMQFSAESYSNSAIANEMASEGHKNFLAGMDASLDDLWTSLTIHTEARDAEDSVERRELTLGDGQAVLLNRANLVALATDIKNSYSENKYSLPIVATGRGYARNTSGSEHEINAEALTTLLRGYTDMDAFITEAVRHRNYSIIVDDADVGDYSSRSFTRQFLESKPIENLLDDMVENPFDKSWLTDDPADFT